jgi:orotidine-5'-phosphate decarboxylase
MALKWDKLIVALDSDDKKKLLSIAKALGPKGVKFKIGLRAFVKFGPSLVKQFTDKGFDVFLDLKLHDIPNTMKQAAAVMAEMGVWAFTVHAKAGEEALRQVKAEVEAVCKAQKKRKPIILAVTELTSSNATPEQVMALIKTVGGVGLDCVCSAHEAAAIRKAFPKMKIVTPGIRGPEDAVGDQKRVMTAKAAFKEGASYIVVGRPIIEKKDYAAAAEGVLSV